nr:MAG TPA: hypothetical protein [Caudoviricetes sp.]
MTEFKHGELLYNGGGNLFYYRTDREGRARYQPVRADQGAYEEHLVTLPVLQAVKEGFCPGGLLLDGTLITMTKGYLVKHGSEMLGVDKRHSGDSPLESFDTALLNEHAVVGILYPPMPEACPGQEGALAGRLVYLKLSNCWGMLVNGGLEVQELKPEGQTFITFTEASEPFTKVVTGDPQRAYRKLRSLPVGTQLATTVGVWRHDEHGFIDATGRRVPPSIQGGWLSKIQGVHTVPAEHKLPSFSPKTPDELLWSKSLKGWVTKTASRSCVTLSDGAEIARPDSKLKPLSKIAQRAKDQKDLRKLEELPAGTVITDSDGDTWVKREGLPFSYDNWLTFDQTTRLQFHEHLIEVPRSSLGMS